MRRALLFLAATACSGLALAQPSAMLERQYEEAQQALEAGDLARSLTAVKSMLAAVPNLPEALNLQGVIYSRQGNATGAEDSFRRALRVQPGYLEARRNVALLLAKNGQHDRAIVEFQRLLAASPDAAEAVQALSRLYFVTGNYSKAIEFLARMRTPESSAMLGVSYFHLGELGKAKTALESAPDEGYPPELAVEVGHTRGVIFLQEGHTEQALQAFGRALDADPSNTEALLGLGQAYFRNGQYDLSMHALERIPEASRDERFFNLQGSALAKNSRLDLAEQSLRRAIQRNPGFEEAHYNLGLVLLKRGSSNEGIAVLQRALARFPRSRNLVATLGIAYQIKGALVAARSTFERLIRLDPARADGYIYLGSAWMEAGDHRKALAQFRLAEERDATSPRTHYLLGLVNTYLLHPDEARTHLRKAAELDGKFCFAYYQLAKLELDAGNLDTAKDFSGRAAACDVNFAEPHFQMSQILARLGDGAGSREELRRFEQLRSMSPDRKYQVFALP